MSEALFGLDRRIQVVAGKGGVGKSTLTAALGLRSARAGKRTLIIGSDAREGLSKCLDERPFVYAERMVGDNLWAANISGNESLEEFLKLKIRVRAVYNQLLKRDAFRYFTAAAPGLEELFILGKLWFLCQQKTPDGALAFERVVFDSPATGHGLSLFRTPHVIMDTMRVGPIHHYTKDVHRLLTDPAQTSFHIVTLAEEMPVNESIELDHAVVDDVGMTRGSTFVNALYPEVVPEPLEGVWAQVQSHPESLGERAGLELSAEVARMLVACGERVSARRRLAEGYLERIDAELAGRKVEVPYLFDRAPGLELTEGVVEAIDAAVGPGESA